jgi:hypothetical protein
MEIELTLNQVAVLEWIRDGRMHADRTQRLPTMPAEPSATPEALKPYLGRL